DKFLKQTFKALNLLNKDNKMEFTAEIGVEGKKRLVYGNALSRLANDKDIRISIVNSSKSEKLEEHHQYDIVNKSINFDPNIVIKFQNNGDQTNLYNSPTSMLSH